MIDRLSHLRFALTHFLQGRGGATNSHSGNRSFRTLVKKFQERYLKAKKRDKPSVAAEIVQEIREKGGRFLKRASTTPEGHVLWVDIGDERAKEKTCQALREGAPEIRRKRKMTLVGDKATKKSTEDGAEISPHGSSVSRSFSNDEGSGSSANHTPIVRETEKSRVLNHSTTNKSSPITIRPSAKLTRMRIAETVAVDQMDPEERDLYLEDFLPPDPCIRKQGTTNSYTLNPRASFPRPPSTHDNSGGWPIVKV